MMALTASASYIAAHRYANRLPEAGVYLTLSLGLTFPFNLTLGMPIYYYLAATFAGWEGGTAPFLHLG